MDTFNNPRIKSARIILARHGWVVPSRVEAIAALVARLNLSQEVDAMATAMDECNALSRQLETRKRQLAKHLARIRETAGGSTYGVTIKALGMAENALVDFPENDELAKLSTFLESKLLLNAF